MFTYKDANKLGNKVGKYVTRKIGRKPATNQYVKLGVVFGVAAAVGFVAREIYRRVQIIKSQGHVDAVHDKTLKGSFPASDPPASQYFDIPVNRQ
jgi:hypothetical protein